MSKREIIKALLKKEIPDRMGLNEHFWPFIGEQAWYNQGLPQQADYVSYFDLDIRSITWFNIPGPRGDLVDIIQETDEWIIERDAWGVALKTWKYKAGTPEHMGFAITSSDIWKEQFREACLGITIRDYLDIPKTRKIYEKAKQSDEFFTFSSIFIFEELRKILGDVTMLESILLEPEWITDFCQIMTDRYIEYFSLLFSEVGLPDGMHIYEDLGYTANAFISPQCHRELIHPHHVRLFQFFKDYNLPIILHTCGDFRPHLACIVDSQVDCIQAMEAKTGMNVLELAERYKDRLCFMGNIDITILESGNRTRIEQECLTKLQGMKRLRAPYIFMSDHSIPPSVTLSDYEYILDLYKKHCRY